MVRRRRRNYFQYIYFYFFLLPLLMAQGVLAREILLAPTAAGVDEGRVDGLLLDYDDWDECSTLQALSVFPLKQYTPESCFSWGPTMRSLRSAVASRLLSAPLIY